jgi:phosphomannomutase
MLSAGKDGWTAKISAEFTFDNVRAAAQEIAGALKQNEALVIGYDARFLADKFAGEIVKVMTAAGRGCYLPERDLPWPVVVWEVGDRGAAGGVMVTGGSLAADLCGVKFIKGRGTGSNKQGLEHFEPRERYLKYLESLVDAAAIKKARFKIVVDPMFGSGRGYLDRLLQQLGCEVEEIRNYRDVLFGGSAPDPAEANLAALKTKLAEKKADLGFALNGDAGDFALINDRGRYFPSGHFTGLKASGAILACLRIVELAARKGLKALA